ncbi:peroxidasin homolog [Diadema setosum]|uniref:peroxidasin homolog n=1 Tax=Diadema setosum TaxID=31175 RepID=UPI003B3A1CD4
MSSASHLKLAGTPSDVQLSWSNLTQLSEVSPHQQLDVNCSSFGYPPPTVIWMKEGTVTPINTGSGFSTLSFSHVDRSISGRYLCQADNGIPPAKRENAIIHVFYPPNIKELTVFTANHTKIGIEEYLLCVVEAHPAANVTWAAIGYHSTGAPNTTDVSPSPFDSVIESRLVLAGITTGNSPREFTCIARNKFGVAERTVELSDDKQVSSLTGSPLDVQLNWSNLTDLSEISLHQQLDVNCSSSGYPLPTVSWMKEGTVTPISAGSGLSTLSFSHVDRIISGRYFCQADNGIPPVKNKSAVIHVFYPPNIKELTVVFTEQTEIGNQEYLMCVVEAHPAPTVTWAAIGYHSIGAPNTTDVSPSPFYSVIESRLVLAGVTTWKHSPREYTCVARNQFGVAERTVELSDDKQGLE